LRDHLYWGHANPMEFAEFVKKLLGKDYAKLKKLYYKPRQITQAEKKDLYARYL
jgi:hypothetical protein